MNIINGNMIYENNMTLNAAENKVICRWKFFVNGYWIYLHHVTHYVFVRATILTLLKQNGEQEGLYFHFQWKIIYCHIADTNSSDSPVCIMMGILNKKLFSK